MPILSYDGSAGDLDEDQRAAEGFMTAEYREEYAKLFEVIKDNAPGPAPRSLPRWSRPASSAPATTASPCWSSSTGRPPTSSSSEPVVYKDQVTVTMQKVGDEWLVDDLVTSRRRLTESTP